MAVAGSRIVAAGPTEQVRAQLAAAGLGPARQERDASDYAILPGLIDAHIHTQLGLLRGVAQDMHDWMMKGVLPYLLELKPRWQILSSQLTVMEALKAGTTTFGDFLVFPDPNLFEFYLSSGIRVRPILPVFEIGPGLLAGGRLYNLDGHMGQASYNEALRLHAEYHGAADGREPVGHAGGVVDQALDPLQVEALGLQLGDQPQPLEVPLPVVAGARPDLRRLQQPPCLVLADIAHGHARCPRELVDRELRMFLISLCLRRFHACVNDITD